MADRLMLYKYNIVVQPGMSERWKNSGVNTAIPPFKSGDCFDRSPAFIDEEVGISVGVEIFIFNK